MNYYQLKAMTLMEVLLAWTLFIFVVIGVAHAQLTALQSLRHAYRLERNYFSQQDRKEQKIVSLTSA